MLCYQATVIFRTFLHNVKIKITRFLWKQYCFLQIKAQVESVHLLNLGWPVEKYFFFSINLYYLSQTVSKIKNIQERFISGARYFRS